MYLPADRDLPPLDECGELDLTAYYNHKGCTLIPYLADQLYKYYQCRGDITRVRRVIDGKQDFYLETQMDTTFARTVMSVAAFMLTFNLPDPRLEYISSCDYLYQVDVEPGFVSWIRSNNASYNRDSDRMIRTILHECISFSAGESRLFSFTEIYIIFAGEENGNIEVNLKRMTPIYKSDSIILLGEAAGYTRLVKVDGFNEYTPGCSKTIQLISMDELMSLVK